MERYRIDGIEFEMYDVGGQRSERRKWLDCFDNVDAVLFVAALSEYDQKLAEARRTNRMIEALELFRSVCNNRAFSNSQTSIMLFLNKKDVFAEKILYSDIQAQPEFKDYGGPARDFNHGVMYFITRFKECLISDEQEFKDSFIHVTCATDTNNSKCIPVHEKTKSSNSSTFLFLTEKKNLPFVFLFTCSGIRTGFNTDHNHDRQPPKIRVSWERLTSGRYILRKNHSRESFATNKLVFAPEKCF